MVSGTEKQDTSMLKSVEVLITWTSLEERSISRISGNRVGEAATVKRELPEIDKSPIAVYGKSRFLTFFDLFHYIGPFGPLPNFLEEPTILT